MLDRNNKNQAALRVFLYEIKNLVRMGLFLWCGGEGVGQVARM